MWKAKVGRKLKPVMKGQCPPLQPHQEAVAFMLHPQSPISRMLVDHPTGSGKTREMICVLDNYYLDPRPKVPIFPKEPVCRNFYMELLRWPSRYRDFFACLRPQDAAKACGCTDWRSRRQLRWDLADLSGVILHELCCNLREVLEMKGWFYMGRMRRSRREAFRCRFPDEDAPAAPLRALRYTSAGGRHADLRQDGWPVSALLKVAFDRAHAANNAYSNKVVIMDEVHNLVRLQTQYGQQLARLRTLLSSARGSVLVGFTGTPILNEASEGRQLLDIVKGVFAPRGDGGFLSSFPMRPVGLFPTSFPRGVPDGIITPKLRRKMVSKVLLTAEALKRYDAKRAKGIPEKRLRAYCNLCVHFGSLHEGRNGSKARILANMEICAPKLFAIAESICKNDEKALILVAHSSGLKALVEHLQERAAVGAKFGIATMEELAEFNSPANLRGELYRVLVADAAQCSEGVSFMAVRKLHLADVPASPSAFVQAVGRAVRMYGHSSLPAHEQTVTVQLWIGVFPRWMRSSLASWSFRAQRRRDARDMAAGAQHLLRRLFAAGVRDLETLKLRLDNCGGHTSERAAGTKPPLSLPQAAMFLEQLGLWEEAKALRMRLQKTRTVGIQVRRKQQPWNRRSGRSVIRMKKAPTFLPVKSQFVDAKVELRSNAVKVLKEEKVKLEEVIVKKEMPDEQDKKRQSQGPLSSSRPVATPQTPQCSHVKEEETATETCGTGDDQTLASLLDPDPPKKIRASRCSNEGEAQAPTAKADFAWERDPLVRMMQCLYSAQSAAEAERELFLNMRTADEEALRNLSQRTREFVPALTAFRKKAVDRAILWSAKREKGSKENVEESDGQSSSIDFGLTDVECAEPRTLMWRRCAAAQREKRWHPNSAAQASCANADARGSLWTRSGGATSVSQARAVSEQKPPSRITALPDRSMDVSERKRQKFPGCTYADLVSRTVLHAVGQANQIRDSKHAGDRHMALLLTTLTFGPAAAGFDPAPARARTSKPTAKRRGKGKGFGLQPAGGQVSKEEQRRQQRLGKDPSMNAARKALLSQIAETRFGLGEVDVDLVVPAYVECSGMRNVQQTQQTQHTLADAPCANQVLDYNRLFGAPQAAAETASTIDNAHDNLNRQCTAFVVALSKRCKPMLRQLPAICARSSWVWFTGTFNVGADRVGSVSMPSSAAHTELEKGGRSYEGPGGSQQPEMVLQKKCTSAETNGVDRSTTAFDWSDKDSWPKPFGGLTAAADVLYDKQVVSSLVDLIMHFGGPALLVEPDNVARQQLGSVAYFEEMASSRGLDVKIE
ncbi:unnamed protein product [Symbiodinium pilosum]|uniref:Uncharacterized protein n=1 Tax=Symbiodinium pilosum TaxID=2952 RepID=A0A812IRE6_SYMPI|nr:unnamed protein product [Symbiodinium pilosum]